MLFAAAVQQTPGSRDKAHESVKADFHLRTSCRAGARDFLFSKSVQTGSGAHLAFYPMGIAFRPRGQNDQGVKLTTQFHLVPRLRMNGAIPLLSRMLSSPGQGKLHLYIHLYLSPKRVNPEFHYWSIQWGQQADPELYRGADKSLARPTSLLFTSVKFNTVISRVIFQKMIFRVVNKFP